MEVPRGSKMLNQHLLRNHALSIHALLHHQRARAAALQSELQALQLDVATCISKEQDAFETLARAECSQICNGVMSQLPRELRDMVYQHLSTESEERINREYFRSVMDPETRMHTYDVKKWKATHYPEHYWDAEYVGSNFLEELVSNYYHTSTFVFGDDDGLIEQFLGVDQMKMGYAPKELVSKMEIYLNAVTYDRETCVGYMFGSATKPERLQAALRGIQNLKTGASICVHFSTRAKDGEQKEEQIMTACTALTPCLRDAKAAGREVRLIIDKGMEVELEDVPSDCEVKQRQALMTTSSQVAKA